MGGELGGIGAGGRAEDGCVCVCVCMRGGDGRPDLFLKHPVSVNYAGRFVFKRSFPSQNTILGSYRKNKQK